MFTKKILTHFGSLECAAVNPGISGTGSVLLETPKTVMTIDDVSFLTDMNVKLLVLSMLNSTYKRYVFEKDVKWLMVRSAVLAHLNISSYLLTMSLL